MHILYIGHYEEGSTSKMRGDLLKEILVPEQFTCVNIDIPLKSTNRIFRSFGWRYKAGPLIKNINSYIVNALQGRFDYDMVWIDKGVFIDPALIKRLKENSGKLIHFTPDPAFTYHRSRLFFDALKYYDVCVTTKSYEVDSYKAHGAKKLITCTQGFHPDIHKPYFRPEEKRGVMFVGHHEENREAVIARLLEKHIDVTLAGIKWSAFAEKHKARQNLHYLGDGVFGADYAKVVSGAQIGLGFLSKIVPELHTTRTFEIPACGTALITERNEELEGIFNDDEVIFVNSEAEFVERTEYGLANPGWLIPLTGRGYKKVTEGGYDYKSILKKILSQISE